MSQSTRESLSALMDSESDELELRRVLKSLPDDADAADTWRRYHLARSMMQRESGVDVSVDLSAGIMARLQDEPAPVLDDTESVAPRSAGGVSFARGAGVAAAVSLMVITGVQFLGGTNGGSSQAGVDGGMVASQNGAGAQVQPVGLAASQPASMTPSDMPMFEPTAFRVNGQSGGSGFMNVSDGGFASSDLSRGMATPQSAAMDGEQIRLLQSYLEQHAQGAANGTGDSWMPLLRSSSMAEPLGQR